VLIDKVRNHDLDVALVRWARRRSVGEGNGLDSQRGIAVRTMALPLDHAIELEDASTVQLAVAMGVGGCDHRLGLGRPPQAWRPSP
jgi:hypothetical protein